MPTWPPGNEELERVSLENLADWSLQDADRGAQNDPGSMPEVHSSFMNLMVQLNAL